MRARSVQLPLFAPPGEPWSEEEEARWLRVRVLQALADVFGVAWTGVECPRCSDELRVLLWVRAPFAWSACGWVLPLRGPRGRG